MERVTGLSGLSGSDHLGLKSQLPTVAAHTQRAPVMPVAALLLAVGFILAALVSYEGAAHAEPDRG